MASFFSAGRKAPWGAVALGTVGASMSGVTFVSVPGNVFAENFYYLPMVLGFCIGYALIGWLLLPWYYSRNVVSIYSLIGERFGRASHLTCSVLFMVSKFVSVSVRISIVLMVLMSFFPDAGPITLICMVFLFIMSLYLYTYKGGVKTLIYTDVIQTLMMLAALMMTVWYLSRDMGWTLGEMQSVVANSGFSCVWDTDFGHPTNFVKQLISGILVTVAMTGLDQGMMQKHLACRNLRSARKNLLTTSGIIFVVNIVFLYLGAILALFVSAHGGLDAMGISSTDSIFPTVVHRYMSPAVGVVFIVGLICASYPSSGAAMTSLTTAVCVDFMHFSESDDIAKQKVDSRIRKIVQAFVSLGFMIAVVMICFLNEESLINLIYRLVSYTYGPLLGIFAFAIFTRREVLGVAVPWVALCSPVFTVLINAVLKKYCGFDFGFALLAINGILTYASLLVFSKKKHIFAA